MTERKPVDPANTLFRPGSVSKLFTWTAVMQLVEQGKLDLDADINQYLDFKVPPYDGQPITLRNIMTHTSGLEEHVRGLITSNPKDTIALGDYVKMLPTRIYAPGKTPSYSNFATTLAGYIIQRVSGQPFDDYIEQHIFKPLDMQHATFRQPLPENLKPLMSKGYAPGSDKPKGFEIVNPAPAGSLSASGEAMAHFMIAHLQQGAYGDARILSAATARQMHTTALTILPDVHRMLLGFYEENINGHRVIGHAGDTQWFHSDLHLFMDDGVGLFVSMNSSGSEGSAHKLREALLRNFANRYMPGPWPDGKVAADEARQHAQQMVGVYENSRREDDTFTSLLNLVSQTKVTTDGKDSISVPSITDLGGQPVKWREIAPYIWRDIDSGNRLAATLVDGKVQRFAAEPYSPFMVFDPVPWWKSSSWLLPMLIAGAGALLLTLLAWPLSALIRRYYGIRYGLSGRAATAHRAIRWTSLAMLAVLLGVVITLAVMFSDFNELSASNDWLVHVLRLLALVVFPIGTLVSLWNAWVVVSGKRRWTAKLWSIVLALSCLAILWASWAFGLPGFSANY